MGKASQSGGVKPMSIAGRLVNERERLLGMTDAERAFRKQWLQDQILSPNEPRHVPQIYKATFNPIRRFYRFPLDLLENKVLSPRIGATSATVTRMMTAKLSMICFMSYWMWYYYKYNSNNWERKGGIKLFKSREAVDLGDPGYPCLPNRTKGADYASRGFDKVTLNL